MGMKGERMELFVKCAKVRASIRWAVTCTQEMQASAVEDSAKQIVAETLRKLTRISSIAEIAWLCHFSLSVPRPELLEAWNPWVVLRAGQRTLQEKPSGQGARKKTVDAQESGENSLFLFLFAVFHACLKPKQPCDKRGDSGNRNWKASKSWEGSHPPELGSFCPERVGKPFCFSLSLCTHLVWEVSIAPRVNCEAGAFQPGAERARLENSREMVDREVLSTRTGESSPFRWILNHPWSHTTSSHGQIK